MGKLTKVERLAVYQYILKRLIESEPVVFDPNVYDPIRNWTHNERRVNICRFIVEHDITRQTCTTLHHLPELQSLKPTKSFKSYWFHPNDATSRITLVNIAIKNCKVSIWDRIFHVVKVITYI